jgi:hypothetical protein
MARSKPVAARAGLNDSIIDGTDSHARTWAHLVAFLIATVGVAGMIGKGRGNYPFFWSSRYCTLLIPIGIAFYLLLVRLQAPVILSAYMAMVMTVGWAWSWPEAIRIGRTWHHSAAKFARALRKGQESIGDLVDRHAAAVNYTRDPAQLRDYLLMLREKRMSVFRP